MGDEIRRGIFKEKIMPELGTLILKDKVFGIKFNEDVFENNKLKTDKMIFLKKNINLAMETKYSTGVRQKDILDIDGAMREVRPNSAVITHIDQSADQWLNNNLDIDSLLI